MKTSPDIFAEARDKFTVPALWEMLSLPGDPKPSCKSPFREEKSPSFTIFDDGRKWKDHGTGEGGDVVELLRIALGIDHREARIWFADKLGTVTTPPRKPLATMQAKKRIVWPAELVEGTWATWEAFARHKGLTFPAVHMMVEAGVLRFCKIDGVKCFVVTDAFRRSAEIRRIDGGLFGKSKVYPLSGVEKAWLSGLELLVGTSKNTAVLITEGSTDLLASLDLYSRFRREHGGTESWQPAALLGAGCKELSTDAAALLRGRHVRLVPDADAAGDKMADYWSTMLRKIGCSVDIVDLPPGTDLSDNLHSISPTDLFSK